ncbi:hypothetical protein [Helicobacter sp. 12S02634-8]|nr:hypothetical protein [Helicobacter sp. 12S02634-8]
MKTLVTSVLGIYFLSGCASTHSTTALDLKDSSYAKARKISEQTIWIPRQ